MGEFAKIKDAIGAQHLDEGFRIPALIRFVGQEMAYLSTSNDGPRMYVNIEDHLSHQTGLDNIPFQVKSKAKGAYGAKHLPGLEQLCATCKP